MRILEREVLRGRRRHITFLTVFAYATGGVPRAVFSVANELAEHGHDVTVVSVYRTEPEPFFDVRPDVRLDYLEDRVDPAGGDNLPRARRNPRRSQEHRRLDRRPSELASSTPNAFSALIDLRLREYLSGMGPGILVTTRPELAIAATRWAPDHVATVHQEHLTFKARREHLRSALAEVASGLSALVTLTEADRRRWARRVGPSSTMFEVIPNAPTFAIGRTSAAPDRVVIAAGRLTRQKAFNRLIDAFAPVAACHPDWELHIYGRGSDEAKLNALIGRLGLERQVVLQGFTTDYESRLASASVYAMSSRFEGFPMVLLEAMTKGVPPISVDCPEGPRQIIDDGRNGLLVGRGDVEGLSRGLARLVEDAELRERLSADALSSAQDYTAELITDRWESLFAAVQGPGHD